ncbi:urease accessory protein UreD [Methylobacter luteus]|uniref:urease accessory protein UreD n=1 Tax=Methylobacter luteus TaxID=415 RepID=UPI00040AC544|nr:urease accessory protein UreD [Methylobacter luteus]
MLAGPKKTGCASVAGNSAQGWEAKLALGFARQHGKTVLAHRRHYGPLTVQRPFYPEGGVCHVYILHPPGGIVAGDHLSLEIDAEAGSHALITTPAAGKFYRSAGGLARQDVSITVAEGAALEWLPQETIIYEGARLRSTVRVELASKARFIGWEILSLGRPACGERFDEGLADLDWQVYCRDQPLLLERLKLDARAFAARWGLQGCSACGTLFAYPAGAETLAAVQQLIGDATGRGVTRMDDLLVCRALDCRSDRLRVFFERVWAVVRPDCVRREACAPRIWAT